MSRILLVRPPVIFTKGCFRAPATMPLSLAYLAASLLERQHEVEVVDAVGEGIDLIGPTALSERILRMGLPNEAILSRIRTRPDAFGVGAMFSQDWPYISRLVADLRSAFPGVPIIVGGEHATACADYILATTPAVDCVALGEGEDTIVDFAEHLDGRKRLDEVPGLKYRDRGSIRATGPRARIRAVDEIPWPAWHLLDLDPYFAGGHGQGIGGGRTMPLLATRGCPYQCTFCSSPQMWTTRYAMRSPADVADEIGAYIDRYRIDNVDFHDLTAVIRKDWILSFCREVRERGLKFEWELPSGTRSEALDGEVLSAMASSGCAYVGYVPESGSVRTLEKIKKRITLPKMLSSIRQAHREGIRTRGNLIIGFPHESRLDVFKTIWLAVKLAWLGVEDITIARYCAYPGSEEFEELQRDGVIGPLDESFFLSLLAYRDATQPTSYCREIGRIELTVYYIATIALFYPLNLLFRPSRILRFFRNFARGRADSFFESAMLLLVRRFRLLASEGPEGRRRSTAGSAA